ncbi:MAG: acyl-CoA dehydrogenase [Myxococcales bacterium]|nr:acyl-CoA dehydrogenase [Myxococcales bacterium]
MEYRIDKRDIEFVLFEQLNASRVLEFEPYKEFNEELLKMVLSEALKFASEQLAACNEEGDRAGVSFVDGKVSLPQSFVDTYKKFREGGWIAVAHNPEFGGQGLPYCIAISAIEAFSGANSSFMFVPGLTVSAAHLIEVHGDQSQRSTYIEKMYTGEWAGTMCLTEPQAGSAVGDLSTTATPIEGTNEFKISGSKLFISAGDQNVTDNIVHLVLARAEGDPEGIKGISLFIVPKYRAGANGTFDVWNDVTIAGIEHKMGIIASPTCSISFGDDGDCRGYLVGERRQGIVYMFQMMNEARLVTGLQGVALGNAAYQLALSYAKERKQGPKVTDRSSEAKAVAIIEHPDVRRNLMTMKAYGESIRALLYQTAVRGDVIRHSADPKERDAAQDLVDLLTPICKAFATDIGFKMTELAMQVHGGYGYIREYGVEQHMRDVKIASIYEGTNGIQALDLLGRKMRLKGGGLFLRWLQECNQFLEPLKVEGHPLSAMAKEVDGAKNALAEAAFSFAASGKKDPEYPLQHATPFLSMFGHVECARLMLDQARIALDKLQAICDANGIDPGDDHARRTLAEKNEDVRFYDAKVHTARFFIYQLLPQVGGYLKSIKSNDRSALEVVL